jgi:hypothetical protein
MYIAASSRERPRRGTGRTSDSARALIEPTGWNAEGARTIVGYSFQSRLREDARETPRMSRCRNVDGARAMAATEKPDYPKEELRPRSPTGSFPGLIPRMAVALHEINRQAAVVSLPRRSTLPDAVPRSK